MSPAASLLVLAILVQITLTLAVYAVLYRARGAAVRSGEMKLSDYVVPTGEPPGLARISRSVASQYELPVLFYVLALVVLAVGVPSLIDVLLACVFVLSRVVHAVVHVTREDVRLRAGIFLVGFVVVVLMALRVAMLALL